MEKSLFPIFFRIGVAALATLAALGVTSQSSAQSFDCQKASTTNEKLICSNKPLGGLDESLAATVRETLAKLPQQKTRLLAEERSWIVQRDKQCASVPGRDSDEEKVEILGCLTGAYLERIETLRSGTGYAKAPELAPNSAAAKPIAPAGVASFNCAKATSQIEINICADGALGKLDVELAVELKAALSREKAERSSLLAKQRDWLQERDKICPASLDADLGQKQRAITCLSVVYAKRIVELQALSQNITERDNSPKIPSKDALSTAMDGKWSATFSCSLIKEECADRSDIFSLELWSSGNKICGVHVATGLFGNKVDEGGDPSIVGTIKNNIALVAYKSSWGGSGHAIIIVLHNNIYWEVTDDDNAASYVWPIAVLVKEASQNEIHPACEAERPE